MAGGAKVVIGADVREVKPALDSVSRSVVQVDGAVNGTFQGWVGNSNAVATATEKLERQLKGFASEQRQQGRMARFYANELASIVPAAGEAKGAIQGLAGIVVEGISGGLSFGLAFEAVKFGIEQVTSASREYEERLKAMEAASLAVAKATGAARDELDKLTSGPLTSGQKAFRETFAAGTSGAQDLFKEMDKLRPTTWQLVKAFIWDGSVGMQRLQEESAAAAKNLDRMVESARDIATAAQDFAGGFEESPEQEKRYWQIKAQDAADLAAQEKKVAEQAKRVAEEVARADQVIRTSFVSGYQAGEMPDIFYDEKKWQEMAPAVDMRRAMDSVGKGAKGDGFATDMVDPTNMLGSDDALVRIQSFDEAMKSASKSGGDLASIGGAIGDAFGGIGAAIGGVGGAIASQIGTVAALTVKFIGLAIAAAEASAAETPVVGWLLAAAAGVTVAASIAGLLGSVGARADGGPVSGYGTYLVGERGPELLQMGPQSGTIVPNEALGAGGSVNITFNAPVDATWWRQNERHIVRTLREAARAGRTG